MASAAATGLYRNMETSKLTYADLGRRDIRKLTSVLSCAPAPNHNADSIVVKSYRQYTRKDIKKLHPRLLSHSSTPLTTAFCRGITMAAAKTHLGEPKHDAELGEYLCSLHSLLNRSIIGSLFRVLIYEIENAIPKYVNRLVEADMLLDTHVGIFSVLKSVPQMWMTKGQYERLSSDGVKMSKIWSPQPDGCVACSLGRIGGSQHVIFALRAGMIARLQESRICHGYSARLCFVTCWLKRFDKASQLLDESYRVGMEVKQMTKALRCNQRSSSGFSLPSNTNTNVHYDSGRKDTPASVKASPAAEGFAQLKIQQEDKHGNSQSASDSYGSTCDIGSLYQLYPELSETRPPSPSHTPIASDCSGSFHSLFSHSITGTISIASDRRFLNHGNSIIGRHVSNTSSMIEDLEDAHSRTYVNSTSSTDDCAAPLVQTQDLSEIFVQSITEDGTRRQFASPAPTSSDTDEFLVELTKLAEKSNAVEPSKRTSASYRDKGGVKVKRKSRKARKSARTLAAEYQQLLYLWAPQQGTTTMTRAGTAEADDKSADSEQSMANRKCRLTDSTS